MKIGKLSFSLLIALIVLFGLTTAEASNATSSTQWEIVTYNGFDSAVKAWTRVALIFSDARYKGLFISAIVLGAVVIFISSYIRIAMGARSNGVSWAVPVLAGMAIYTAFIVPTNKLVISDEALNRGPVTIDGVPMIIATSAGLLNKIERGFTEIIDTSTDPASKYRLNAGGTGWQLVDPPLFRAKLPINVQDTIAEYVRNCVYVELLREGTTLKIDDIANGQVAFNDIIEAARNPWWFTKDYISNSTGVPNTCDAVGSAIINTLNSYVTAGVLTSSSNNPYSEAIRATCASRGFDASSIVSLNTCQNLLLSSVKSVFPNQSDLGSVYRQAILAEIMRDVVTSDSIGVAMSLMATSQTMSQFIGLGVHANSWIPVLKASLTAVAISITPMLLLFAATPLVGRALSLVLGMFVWLTIWSIIDAIIHSFGVDLAEQASSAIKSTSGNAGIASLLAWPGYSAKVAATFGALRWSGLMLASVISGMLIKFGGTALAMLAGSISSMSQSSGATYGSILRNSGGVLQSEIIPTQTWSNAAAAMGGQIALARGLVEKGSGELMGQSMFGYAAGSGRIAEATLGNLMGGAAGGLKTHRDMSVAPSVTGMSNPLDSLTRLRQMGVDINYDRQGNPIVQGSASGALPIAGTFNPQTGRFDNGIFRVNDPALSARVSQTARATHAASFAMSNRVFSDWAVSQAKEYFSGKRGIFSETVGRRLDNTFEQYWGEKLDYVRNVLESEGFTRTHTGRGTSRGSVGGGLDADLEKKLNQAAAQSGKNPNSLKDLGFEKGGVRLFYDFNTQKVIAFDTKSGTLTDAKISTDAQEGIRSAVRDTMYAASETTFSTESGFRDLTNLARRTGGEIAQKAEESWSKAEEYAKQAGVDYTPYVINQMVDKYFGDRTPENYQKAFEMLRDAVAKGEADKLLADLGLNFADPKKIEGNINQGKANMQQVLDEIRSKVDPYIVNPSGDPRAVPLAIDKKFLKSPDYDAFRAKVKQFDKMFSNVRDAQEFIKHNTWLLGTLEKLRDIGINPEWIAPNLYGAYRTVNTPISKPGSLPATETQKQKMDGTGLDKMTNDVLGLPNNDKYKIWR